jgi:hypothetical protein
LKEQKRLIDQRKENVKDMLMNVPRVNPDYGTRQTHEKDLKKRYNIIDIS